jgi:hypothetical protein
MTSTDTEQGIDEATLEKLMEQVVGYMTGGAMCFGMWLGDELGLYRVLAGSGSMTSDEIASKAGCNARLVREWLDGKWPVGSFPGMRRRTDISSRRRGRWSSPTRTLLRSSPAR